MEAINNRYEFVMLFDVENGNPNGDPDAGNMPRVDDETGLGLVTDVCLKRKIRNYVDLVKEGVPGFNILIKSDEALNTKFTNMYTEANHTTKKTKEEKGQERKAKIQAAKDAMCRNYFDVRTFGAVMNTGDYLCGIVRGPVQITFAKSVDPIYGQELTITRQAITKEDQDKETEMGKKHIVPYALYRAEGFISANLAQKETGFSEEDLQLLFEAIENMFEHDRSAARGKMCMRNLIVFRHDSALGNAPAHKLLEKVTVLRKPDVAVARAYADYTVTVDRDMPAGVTIVRG